MPDFTPRDEISDWTIATAHELVRLRLEGVVGYKLLNAPANPQAMWEVLITVARSIASILRPDGVGLPGPIGDRHIAVHGSIARCASFRSLTEIESIVQSAAQLIGCAADEDFQMCRALAAAVISTPGVPDAGPGVARGRLVARAMLEILIHEPVDPAPEETP